MKRAIFAAVLVAIALQAQVTDPFLAGAPLTLEQIERAVSAVFEPRLIRAIQSRKVAFAATAEHLDKLREAGATPAVLDAIRLAAPPDLPAAPKKRAAVEKAEALRPSTLTIRCVPAECEVLVDGKSTSSSSSGVASIPNLEPRKHSVVVRKAGYVDVTFPELELPAGEVVTRGAELALDKKLAQERGAALLARMQEALGGSAFSSLSGSLGASGDAVFFNAKGERSEWTIWARLHPPNWAYFQLKGAGASFWVSMVGEQYRSSRLFSKQPLATEIEGALRLFRDYQIAALIQRMKENQFSVSQRPDTAAAFVAENAADSFEFTIGPDSLPQSVRYTSRAGLGTGLTVLYADYAEQDKAKYPTQIVIKLPDAAQHGAEFRFQAVTLGARFTERDFR